MHEHIWSLYYAIINIIIKSSLYIIKQGQYKYNKDTLTVFTEDAVFPERTET